MPVRLDRLSAGFITGGGRAVRADRVAGRQQPRPAEQLLAQGTGQVIALIGTSYPPSCARLERMTLQAKWFRQQEHGGFPVERAALGSCDLSVLHVGGEWQWLVRQAD